MGLHELRRGQAARIGRIADDDLRARLIRLGVTEGSAVRCAARGPLGALVVSLGRQRIAIGRGAARGIEVVPEGRP